MRAIAFDRLIESAIPLPGAIPVEDPGGRKPDLCIGMVESGDISQTKPIYELAGEVLNFSPPGVATYQCSASRIAILADRASNLDDVVALLLATALPATLWLSGDFVLHAAAVRLPTARLAVAFAGPSGIGKSTLAAALVARGSKLVADDTARITFSDGEPIVSGLPGGWFSGLEGEVRPFHPAPPDRMLGRCPLGAIVILSQSGNAEPPFRVSRVDAVEQLLANRHRPAIPALLRNGSNTLQFCAFLAAHVPVYLWQRQNENQEIDDRSLEWLMRCLEGRERP